MFFRFGRIATALFLLWCSLEIAGTRDPLRVRPLGTRSGPVRILQFYASVAAIVPGQKARVCYGVENARTVRISPQLDGVYPSPNHCVVVVPERTTHYTIVAEGFDGSLRTQSVTLAVRAPVVPAAPVQFAEAPQNPFAVLI